MFFCNYNDDKDANNFNNLFMTECKKIIFALEIFISGQKQFVFHKSDMQ